MAQSTTSVRPIDWGDELEIARVRHAIQNRTFFPEENDTIDMVQTHISTVFLTPRFVFKFKRPVDLSFADFRTLRRRRHYCAEEVRLNRRLAPDVYLRVAALRQAPEGYAFEGKGRILDYAVVMKRLPEQAMLNHRLRQGEVLPEEIDRLADFLARFHRRIRGSPRHARYGEPEIWRVNWDENFRQTEPAIGETISREDFAAIRQAVEGFMEREQALFAGRVSGGFIRNGHGDLRCEHICLGVPIRIIDCVEFNERFRYGDTANDLAFLLMDLGALGRPDLSRQLFLRYLERTGDRAMAPLMPFYACYRAYVRGKVTSLRLQDRHLPEDQRRRLQARARGFFELAAEFARQMAPPMLLLVAGLMGTGKSHLAAALGRRTGTAVLASDHVRKELAASELARLNAAVASRAEYGQGIYSAEWNQRTYNALLERAQALLRVRRSVILDATFSRRFDRQRAFALAHKEGAEPVLVECRLPDELALARLMERERSGGSLSDGRAALYPAQKAAFEPIDDLASPRHLVLRTDQPVEALVERVLAEARFPVPNRLFSLPEDAPP
jgi:aminoglycoside phosphotransferase family enzyme/predicted kinase